jgi:hypothetical protein
VTREEYRELWQTPWYRNWVRRCAREIGADGCSGPTLQVFKDGCYEHDIHYYYHADIYNNELVKAEADQRLQWYIWDHSWIGEWSLFAWWRYKALKTGICSDKAWEGKDG